MTGTKNDLINYRIDRAKDTFDDALILAEREKWNSTINSYIKKHLKNNPSENEKDLRKRLNSALVDYKKGIKCACGNDIRVIGSASVGNSCFTCITGESFPTDDYEIKSAIKKEKI